MLRMVTRRIKKLIAWALAILVLLLIATGAWALVTVV